MTGVSRRTFITGSAAAAVLAGVGFNNTAEAAAIGNDGQTYRLTVMGTTDLHGNVFNWDYFKNAEYDDFRATTTSGWPRCRAWSMRCGPLGAMRTRC